MRHDMTAVLIDHVTQGATLATSDDRDGRQLTGKINENVSTKLIDRIVGPKADKNSDDSRMGLASRGSGVVFN